MYFPDFPLPGFAYTHEVHKNLQLVLGVPYSSVHWEPIEHLKFDGGYTLLSDLDANVGYEFIPKVTAYAKYEIVRDAFHVEGLPKDRRLLFQTRRAELGLHWDPCKNCDADPRRRLCLRQPLPHQFRLRRNRQARSLQRSAVRAGGI